MRTPALSLGDLIDFARLQRIREDFRGRGHRVRAVARKDRPE